MPMDQYTNTFLSLPHYKTTRLPTISVKDTNWGTVVTETMHGVVTTSSSLALDAVE